MPVPDRRSPVLRRLGLREDQWHTQATGIEQRYWRAVGAVDALIEKARTMGQCWLKGAGQRDRMPTVHVGARAAQLNR